MPEKFSRLDSLAQQNLNTSNAATTAGQSTAPTAETASSNTTRPGLYRTSSANTVQTPSAQQQTGFNNNSYQKQNFEQSTSPSAQSNGGEDDYLPSSEVPGVSRPSLGPRATSFNPSHLRSNSRTPHKRTNSHSPTNVPVKAQPTSSNAPSPAASLFASSSSSTTTGTSPATATNNNNNNRTQTQQYNSYIKQEDNTSTGPGDRIDSESIGVWVKGESGSQQRLNPHLYTYLASINAFSMPLRPNRDALIRLYCESVDKVLPLLDRDQFVKLHNIGQAPTLLLHAVLLVAARHPQASQYLGRQSVRQFCATTAAKIRALLFADVEQDRLTLVRIYALLSLHAEGPDGLENSCADIQKAMHYAISLGLHHEKPFVEKEELNRLWWTLWCMDRINACVNARPLIIDLKDTGLKFITEQEHKNLGRLVKMCYKLERVIYLYRPSESNKVVPPDVNDMFVGDDTFNPFQAILALLHHTAVILAHKRMDGGTDDHSLEEENVVTEVAGLTAPTVLTQNNKNSNVSSNFGQQSATKQYQQHQQQERQQGKPNQSNSGRTLGTMYTPLTMVLAEEKMKMNGSKHEEDALISNLEKQFFNDEETRAKTSPKRASSDHTNNDNTNNNTSKSSEKINGLLLSAAGSILRIIKNSTDLPPLPLVPYCASLTLTVFLRTYPRHDSETGFNWKDSCTVLESMADRWWVAGAMGSMGWNVFRSLEEERKQNEQQQQQQAEEEAAAAAAAQVAADFSSSQIYDNENDTIMAGQQPQPAVLSSSSFPEPTTATTSSSATAFGYSNFDASANSNTNLSTPSLGNQNNNSKTMEEQFLNMFSDLPNQTSFIDQALTLQSFESMEPWLEEKDP